MGTGAQKEGLWATTPLSVITLCDSCVKCCIYPGRSRLRMQGQRQLAARDHSSIDILDKYVVFCFCLYCSAFEIVVNICHF